MSEQKFVKALQKYKIINESIKNLQDNQAKTREYIFGYVKKFGSQEYEGSKCYIQDRSKILYDIDKIKRRFGKRIKSFIDDKLTFDTSYFLSVCKQQGIDYHLFLKKGQYERSEKVNEKNLSQLIDKGEISYEEMKGCYTVEENSSLVIRLN